MRGSKAKRIRQDVEDAYPGTNRHEATTYMMHTNTGQIVVGDGFRRYYKVFKKVSKLSATSLLEMINPERKVPNESNENNGSNGSTDAAR